MTPSQKNTTPRRLHVLKVTRAQLAEKWDIHDIYLPPIAFIRCDKNGNVKKTGPVL